MKKVKYVITGIVFLFILIQIFIQPKSALAQPSEIAKMKTLAPNYFVNGKRPALTQQGADLINDAIEWAFNKNGTYKQQYCSKPTIGKRSGKKRIQILGLSTK